MDPNAYPAGFPVPSPSPNPMSFYPNNYPQQFAQSKGLAQPGQQQHSFGMPIQPGAGGAMMPQGFPQSSGTKPPPCPHFRSLDFSLHYCQSRCAQCHFLGHGAFGMFPASMDNFSTPFPQTSAPANLNHFSQPNSAMNTPSTVAQTFSQNMASISANNLLANQPRNQINSPKVPQPGTPNQNQNTAQGQSSGQTQAPPPALTPAQLQAQAQAVAREKVRVMTLLDINSTLLQEIANLQAGGKTGSGSHTDGANGFQGSKPSQEYIDCMRRLQANLAYLASITDKQRRLPAPAILTPPPNVPTLNDTYKKLNELFPRPGQVPAKKFSPGLGQGNGGPSPSPMPDPVA
ncbi:hypothetical protein N7470_005518 [Penicillium chermesinum]|nr:hypothetical protein N7470_005518 [Penicillium chermesinum]